MMRDDDWTDLFQGAETLNFENNAIIIEEGKKRDIKLLQVVRGTLDIMQSGKVIGRAGTNDIFGEYEFVEKFQTFGTQTAAFTSAQVTSPQFICRSIDLTYIKMCFVYKSDLAGRFFLFLCQHISQHFDTRLKLSK